VNQFVIADPKKCIGCRTCLAGCAAKHHALGLQDSPRLFLTQTRAGTMPIQCRHCDDAPCAKVCPVGAITIKNHTVQLNEGVCIGCKMCALACAFGAVTVGGTLPATHPVHVGQFSFSDALTWPGAFYADSARQPVHPILDWTIGQKTVAIKCDFCRLSETGPECVRVCPTGALRLINEQVISDLSLDRRTRAVAEVASGIP
jgi:hydrogenase-4 component A